MSENEAKKRWYVIHVYSSNEASVKQKIIDATKRAHMEDKLGEILVPTESVVEMRAGRKCKSQRKFFPGYVLIELMLDDDMWYLVNKTQGVLGFIGGAAGSKPAPLHPKEVQSILSQLESTADKPRPKVLFEVGEVVRVGDGPFADFSGVVEEVNYEKSRLRVAVLIFGRSTPVELEFSQVEKM